MPSSTSSSEAPRRARNRLAALVATFAALVLLGLGAWQAMPPSAVSSQRYLAAVDDHLTMLEQTKGQPGRIVLIGGSAAAFSVSAEALSQELGRPVINGGIQAGIGMRNLVDLYLPHLDPERDLIVLMPEPEMLSAEGTSTEVWCDVIFLRRDLARLARHPGCLPGILWRTWQEGQHHLASAASVDQVYRRSGFNAYGDLVSHLGVERPAPNLADYALPAIAPQNIVRVTDYAREELRARGFAVLYIPAAMPRPACIREPDRIAGLIEQLGEMTSGGAITAEMARFCLAPDLFYDGPAHLGARGRAVHTRTVAAQLALYLSR